MKEIEELKWCDLKEGKLDLTEDDGLEYLVKLADELWPIFSDEKYRDLDKDHPDWSPDLFEWYGSGVAPRFLFEYMNGRVDQSPVSDYLGDRIIAEMLELLGLDHRKFWYLCLGVKWAADIYRKSGAKSYPTKGYDSLLEQLEKIVPPSQEIGTLSLKIKGKKHALEITDPPTLCLIQMALREYKKTHKDDFDWLKPLNYTKGRVYSSTQTVAYFTAVMDNFLKAYNPEDKPLKMRRGKYYTRDLIAWIVYILEVDLLGGNKTEEQMENRERFNSEGRTYLNKYIKSYINKVDPTEIYALPVEVYD